LRSVGAQASKLGVLFTVVSSFKIQVPGCLKWEPEPSQVPAPPNNSEKMKKEKDEEQQIIMRVTDVV
jgi:hypothetical protein